MKERFMNQRNLSRRLRQLLVLFALALMPQWIWAQNIHYLECDKTSGTFSEKQISATGADEITSNTYKLEDGHTYIVKDTISVHSRIEVQGNVSIILLDSCELTVNSGIEVPADKTLTIYAQSQGSSAGTLIARAYYSSGEPNPGYICGAPIGGTYDCISDTTINCGTIIIHGGQITANASNGTMGSDGIGGCDSATAGTVEIYGGTVNAIGYGSGVGIGGTLKLGTGVTCYGSDSQDPTNIMNDLTTRYRYMKTTFKNYDFSVCGIPVTSANASNVTGAATPLVSYDEGSNTLTLKGYHYNGTESFVSIGASINSLNVNLLGFIKVENDSPSLFDAASACTVNFITNDTVPGELLYKGAQMNDANVTLNYGSDLSYYYESSLQWHYIIPQKGMFYADHFGIYDFDPQDATYSDYPGKAPTNYNWYFSSAKVTNNDNGLMPTITSTSHPSPTYSYISRMRTDKTDGIYEMSLQYSWVGANKDVTVRMTSLDGNTEYASANMSSGSVVVLRPQKQNQNIAVYLNEILLTFTSDFEFSFLPLGVKFEKVQTYYLKVAGRQVDKANASDVFGDGKVSFNYDAQNKKGTLTLKGAHLEYESTDAVVMSGYNNLTVQLEGNNTILGNGGAFQGTNSTSTNNIIFTTDETSPGTLYFGAPTDKFFVNLSPQYTNLTYLPLDQPYLFNVTNLETASIINVPWEGTGEDKDHPFLIKSTTDLDNLAKYTNLCLIGKQFFELTDDLDYTKKNFVPIGFDNTTSAASFRGTFNGNKKTISGLEYDPTLYNDQNPMAFGFGLFGYLDGTVENLRLYNCKFGVGIDNGAMAGLLGGTIKNCVVDSCIVDCTLGNGGGIVGYIDNNGSIENCTFKKGKIQDGMLMGGITNYVMGGTINNCTVEDSEITNQYAVMVEIGGITPYEGIITNCTVKNTTIECGSGSKAAAIVTQVADSTQTDLSNNVYYADVKIIMGNDTLSGYTHRGTGNIDINDPNPIFTSMDIFTNKAAILYTKELTLPANNTQYGVTPMADNYYQQNGDVITVAPGMTTHLSVKPEPGYELTGVKVTYTPEKGTELKTIPLQKGNAYDYYFVMPEAAATLAVEGTDKQDFMVYDLWINGTQVTSDNKNDIFGDSDKDKGIAATYSFKPGDDTNNFENILFITNATNDDAVIESQIPGNLVIYLGPNSISSAKKIIHTAMWETALIFRTDGNFPGKLSLKTAGEDVISGFGTVVLEHELSIIPEDGNYIEYDNNNRKLAANNVTIGYVIKPLVEEHTVKPSDDKFIDGGEDVVLWNTVIDDILYTMIVTDEQGYDSDEKCIVLNTPMTDADAKAAIDDNVPGTDEFATAYEGFTFMVPAGEGVIKLKIKTLNGYVIKVKVGDEEPVSFVRNEAEVVEIPYKVNDATYVYVYNGGQASSEARYIIRPGKKTTGSVKVYDVTVSPSKVSASTPVGEASDDVFAGTVPPVGQDSEHPDIITTAIKTIEHTVKSTGKWYNLNGQQIDEPRKKGLYIRDGKKVVYGL